MSTTDLLARIPSELKDQWTIEEREEVEAMIVRRNECLAIAADETADIEEVGKADEEAEGILATLNDGWNVTADMLFDQRPPQEESLFDQSAPEAAEPEPELAPPDEEPAGRPEDPRGDEEDEQLTFPGAGKPGSKLSRKVALEAQFIGKGTRLTNEVTDPDAVFRVMALVRFDHNKESPQRSGSGIGAKTESVLKTQFFRVLRFEMREDVDVVLELLDNLTGEERAKVYAALET
jgi:hypothetical protein